MDLEGSARYGPVVTKLVCRKTFVGGGVKYFPGDEIDMESYKTWPRPESVIRSGHVVEVVDTPKKMTEVKPRAKRR